MRVALVHDWLTGMRGGEKVLEVFCRLFPDADIFSLLHVPGTVSKIIESHPIQTSYLRKIPGIEARYRYFLPFMPHAIESFNLEKYDLVISTSHCVAKGCKPSLSAKHVSCCFTPMRYIWDQYDQYFGPQSSWHIRLAMKAVRGYLQQWDVHSSNRVTSFIAISKFVSERIKNYYGRDSTIIYPPVDTDFYRLGESKNNGDFYLMVSALVPYKRIDIAIESFNRWGRPLKIVGSGPDSERLKAISKPNIEFLGWGSNELLRSYYQQCRALIFPGIEDFGIVPIEAMACGKPVIALRRGGVTETVLENQTGLFFDDSNPDALIAVLEKNEQMQWDAQVIRRHAEKFGMERYEKELKEFLSLGNDNQRQRAVDF